MNGLPGIEQLPTDVTALLAEPLAEQHIYHHAANDGPRVNVKVEKNTKGFNYEATILNAASPEDALALLRLTVAQLEAEYGKPNG